MNQELEKLIEIAFADGELSEREKEIILRKAENLGEDIDEVELILEGKIQQLAKVVDANKEIQEFLSTALSPNELYREKFLNGLKESDEDIRTNNVKEVRTFDDFIS